MSSPTAIPSQATDAPAPVLTVKPDDSDPSGMTLLVTADNHGNGPVIILWGQVPALPSTTNPGDGTTKSRRTYKVAGTWQLTAKPIYADIPSASEPVTVPWPAIAPAPAVTAHEDPADPTGMSVLVVVDNHGNGPVKLTWGQPGMPTTDTNPGDGRTTTGARYQAAGTFTITATDPVHLRTPPGTAEVTVPMKVAPKVTVRGVRGDITGMQVQVTVDNHGDGPVVIDWGQNPSLPTATNPGDNRSPTQGTYTTAGSWTITAHDANDIWAPPGQAPVTVPIPVAPTVTAVEDPAVTSGMGVIVTVDSHGAGPVTVDWGQIPALPQGSNPGDNQTQTRQTYAKAGTWTISATDANNVWAPTGSTYVTVPFTDRNADHHTVPATVIERPSKGAQ